MKEQSSNQAKTFSRANTSQPFFQKKSEQEPFFKPEGSEKSVFSKRANFFPQHLTFSSTSIQRQENENLLEEPQDQGTNNVHGDNAGQNSSIWELLIKDRFTMREETRRRFDIPNMGERSGSADTDGWEPFGRYNQHTALVEGGHSIPEVVNDYLLTHEESANRHIEYTLGLFPEVRTDNKIIQDDIDLTLALMLAHREGGMPGLFSNSRARVISAGSDTHPDGVSGLDNLYIIERLFPDTIRRDIRLVLSGYRDGREDRRAASLQRRNLFAALIVTLVRAERNFERHANRIYEADAYIELLTLSEDARRAWIALAFAGTGYAFEAVEYLHNLDLPLEDILTNAYLREKFHVRSAIVTSARASYFDEIQDQHSIEQMIDESQNQE